MVKSLEVNLKAISDIIDASSNLPKKQIDILGSRYIEFVNSHMHNLQHPAKTIILGEKIRNLGPSKEIKKAIKGLQTQIKTKYILGNQPRYPKGKTRAQKDAAYRKGRGLK